MKLDVQDLFYNHENEEGITAAGIIDNMLIEERFNGDWEDYSDQEGYAVRDEIIKKLTEDFELKLKVLVKNISLEVK